MICVRQLRSLAALLPFFLAGTIPPTEGAPAGTSGPRIYREHCARCHGANGEGVKGKYNDALQGDWSVEKLIRYVARSMPEDAPGTCTGDDAAAVARYIREAFYSPEARARNQHARVELVRLTNRQYVNTVADLLRLAAGSDTAAAAGNERGLPGSYRSKRGKGEEDKKTFDRVDRQVDFTFGTSSPDAERLGTGTNEISISWRGAVLAGESGDYEFTVQTPNGARLWVNDPDEPLIDAWVASGELNEHKATLRLLGGRAYALRLEFFKAPKDKSASVSLQWTAPRGSQEIIPARCLTPARATPTFVVTTRFPPDDSSVGYERGVSVSKAWDEATTQAAIEAANHVVARLDRFSRSKPGDSNRVAKVKAFCAEFVTAAFRRPLTDEQRQIFVEKQFRDASRPEDAVKRVVLLALKSPRFLYLGLDGGKPDAFDVAARLSYGLWDSLPDRELTKLAAQGALRTREQISQQARRMMSDPRARAKMQSFLHHWLQMDHVESLAKDDRVFPGFTPEIIADLRTSLNLFLDDVVWSGSSDYRRLLLEDDLFVNDRLAQFYGVNTNAGDGFVRVSIEPQQRAGVLTHPYLLSAFSYHKSTSPIHRGVFLTRNIVGRALKPPPMAVAFKDAEFAPNLTMREKVAELTRPQACQTCHSVINPLGFSLEHFDAVGRFRTHEKDRPIHAASEYVTDDGKKVQLAGARDVAEFALASTYAQDGFVEQLFHQVVKQPMPAFGAGVQERLREAFVASGFNIQSLMVEIVTVSALQGFEQPVLSAKKS